MSSHYLPRENSEGEVADDGQRRLLQRYMPALDVLRGLAILMVILHHSLYWEGAVGRTTGAGRLFAQLTSGGWLGVNLFFVLSGFLITGILLDSRSNEDYYRRFYSRRALRILPAYLFVIVWLLLKQRMGADYLAESLTFTTNYAEAWNPGHRWIYAVFWTLSVEEQFYLVWPTLSRRLGPKGLTLFCGALILADPLLRFLSQSGRLPLGNPHSSTPLIADNLACGALAALFVRSRFGTAAHGRRVALGLIVFGACLEIACIPFGILHRDTLFGAALQSTPWNFFFTGLLLLMLSLPGAVFGSALYRPLRFFGYISYGLYLSHLLVFEAYDEHVAGVRSMASRALLEGSYVRLLLAGCLAALLAWLSRRYFEDPFLRIRVGARPRKLLRQGP